MLPICFLIAIGLAPRMAAASSRFSIATLLEMSAPSTLWTITAWLAFIRTSRLSTGGEYRILLYCCQQAQPIFRRCARARRVFPRRQWGLAWIRVFGRLRAALARGGLLKTLADEGCVGSVVGFQPCGVREFRPQLPQSCPERILGRSCVLRSALGVQPLDAHARPLADRLRVFQADPFTGLVPVRDRSLLDVQELRDGLLRVRQPLIAECLLHPHPHGPHGRFCHGRSLLKARTASAY